MLESLLLSTLERLEQTSRELATVYEISRLIAKGLSFKDFCQSVITQICYSVPDIDGGLIYLYNEFTTDYDLGGSVNVQEMAVSIEETHPLIKFLSENYNVISLPDICVCVGLSPGAFSELAYINWDQRLKCGNLKKLIGITDLLSYNKFPHEFEYELGNFIFYSSANGLADYLKKFKLWFAQYGKYKESWPEKAL